MNSEKVLKKDYKKQTILTIIFFISLISSILIYYYNEKIDGGLEIVFILLIVTTVVITLCLISRLLSNNRLKKAIINYPDIYKELDSDNTIVFDKYGFYFTNKYFITSKNFNIFKYSLYSSLPYCISFVISWHLALSEESSLHKALILG